MDGLDLLSGGAQCCRMIPSVFWLKRAVRVAVVLSVSLWAILCERARVRLRVVAYEGGRAIRCSAKRLWKF